MPAQVIAPVIAIVAFFTTFMIVMAYAVVSSNLAERSPARD